MNHALGLAEFILSGDIASVPGTGRNAGQKQSRSHGNFAKAMVRELHGLPPVLTRGNSLNKTVQVKQSNVTLRRAGIAAAAWGKEFDAPTARTLRSNDSIL
jgi:hypothetical protein